MRVLVLAAALLGSAAATAHADTTQPGSYEGSTYLVAGPVLTGDRIAWATQSPGAESNTYDNRLYSAPVTGGDPVEHAKIGGGTDEQEYSSGIAVGDLAAANGRIAWLTYGWSVQAGKFGDGYFNFQISTLDGPVCGPGSAGTFSMAGDTLAASGCNGVTLRDLAHPGSPPQQLDTTPGPVKVAGTYAAWWTNTGFELLDRTTGARTTLDARLLSGPRRRFDLSPEGVLAVTVGNIHNRHIVWASPTEPTWHTVPLPNLSYDQPIRVRGNRLAFLAYDKGLSKLWLTDLTGTAPTLLAERAYDIAPNAAPFDFDGTTFTWGDTSCGTLTVTAHPIAAGKLALPLKTHCPVLVAATARDGKIRLRCPGVLETDRCKGTVKVGGATAKFDIKAFRTGTAQLKTKRRGTVKVTVRSVTRGHASTTKATVKLR